MSTDDQPCRLLPSAAVLHNQEIAGSTRAGGYGHFPDNYQAATGDTGPGVPKDVRLTYNTWATSNGHCRKIT